MNLIRIKYWYDKNIRHCNRTHLKPRLKRFGIWAFYKFSKDYYTDLAPVSTLHYNVAGSVSWGHKDAESLKSKLVYTIAKKLVDEGFVRLRERDDLTLASKIYRYDVIVTKLETA